MRGDVPIGSERKRAVVSGNFQRRARRVALHSARHRDVRCSAKAETILERIHRSFVAHGGRDVETEPLMSSVSASFERSAVNGGTRRTRLAQWSACVPSSRFVRCKRAQQASWLVTQSFPRAVGCRWDGGVSVGHRAAALRAQGHDPSRCGTATPPMRPTRSRRAGFPLCAGEDCGGHSPVSRGLPKGSGGLE